MLLLPMMSVTTWAVAATLLCVAQQTAAQQHELFCGYFDISAAAGPGDFVTGRVNPKSNKDWRTVDLSLYEFVMASSDVFEMITVRDGEQRIFGEIRIKAGASVGAAGTVHNLGAEMRLLSDGTSVSSCGIDVNVVVQTTMSTIQPKLRDFAVQQNHMWGREEISDSQLERQVSHVEDNGGELDGVDIYEWTPREKRTGSLYSEWVGATEAIGSLAWRYASSPAAWKPFPRLDNELEPLDSAMQARTKSALYAAITKLAAAMPVDVSDVYDVDEYASVENPTNQATYNKDLLGEAFSAYSSWNRLSHNAVTHQWEFTDALGLAAVYLGEDMMADARAGVAGAQDAMDGLVELMHVNFCLTGTRRVIDNPDVRGKWGRLHDTHSQGIWTDANLAHRLRTWVGIMASWQDYNRPVTYVPYWYDDFDHSDFLWSRSTMTSVAADFSYIPGFRPSGVLNDVRQILSAGYVRPRQKQLSGFLPDGFISHHQDYCQDAAMMAYGFEWLMDPVLVAHTVAGTPFEFTGGGFEVPARWLAYSYNRIVFKGHIDWSFIGREYHAENLNEFWEQKVTPVAQLLVDDHGASLPASVTAELAVMAAEPTYGPAGEVNGNTAFYNSESMVHRDNGWYMSVRMRSLRAQGNEDFESPTKSYHMGAGVLKAIVHGDEYDYMRANMDYHVLPGVTEEWRTDNLPPTHGNGANRCGGNSYAGVVSDGTIGLAAFHYMPHPDDTISGGGYSTIDAYKAYFFHDFGAVALGNSINRVKNGQGNAIVTTLEQARWRSDVKIQIGSGGSITTIPYDVDGSCDSTQIIPAGETAWLHQGAVGYIIQAPSDESVGLQVLCGNSVSATDSSTAGSSGWGNRVALNGASMPLQLLCHTLTSRN